jgi:hypothetical protein
MISRISSAAVSLAVAAAAAVGAAGQGSQQKQIYVTVADQGGKPLGGLTAADFAVKEDGVVREVASAAPATDPGFYIVTVDTSQGKTSGRDQLIERNIGDLRNGVVGLIRQIHAAQPQAQVALWEHAGAAIQIRGFTTKTEDLEKDAKRLTYKEDPSVVLEAFADAAKELQKRQTTRRVIIAFSFDSSPEASTMQPSEVARNVRQSGAQVWAVTLRDRPPASASRDNVLNGMTQMTGGARLTINAVSAIESTLKNIADLVAGQYAVTYNRPAGGKPPEQLQVLVKRENVLVAAPNWAPR